MKFKADIFSGFLSTENIRFICANLCQVGHKFFSFYKVINNKQQ